MSVQEFVAQMCNFKLSDNEKKFIQHCYDAIKEHGWLIYTPTRGDSRYHLRLIQALVVLYHGLQTGTVDRDYIICDVATDEE